MFLEAFLFHFHMIAAFSWIGGSAFMFVLGVTLRDKEAQKEVYPHIGPIFGWFELGALIVLLLTGFMLGVKYNLFNILFFDSSVPISDAVTKKIILVFILTVVTVIHFVIAYKTNNKDRSKLEYILSRSSSLLILFLNLFVMHYGILLRNIL